MDSNIFFRTSNSLYEIRREAPAIRRIEGVNPSPFGPDREWHSVEPDYPYSLQIGEPFRFKLTGGGDWHTSRVAMIYRESV